jgi:hypothetical protein
MKRINVQSKLILILALAIFSCENKSDKIDTVDLEEFLPKAKKAYNYEEDTLQQIKKHTADSLELYIKSKISNANFRDKEELSNNKHFPDRLDYTQKFYHELIIDSTLYELVVWNFEDSLHTVNAFYNWIDCFGKTCKSIRVGESKWIYDGSFQLLVDDKRIIYISSEKTVNQRFWGELFQPITDEKWSYNLHQPLKRKVQWIGLSE